MSGEGNVRHIGKVISLIPHVIGTGRQRVVFQLHIGAADFQTALFSRHDIPLLGKTAIFHGKLNFRGGRDDHNERLFVDFLPILQGKRHIRAICLNGGNFVSRIDKETDILFLTAGILKLKLGLPIYAARFGVGTHVCITAGTGDSLHIFRGKYKIIIHIRAAVIEEGLAHIEQAGTGYQCRRYRWTVKSPDIMSK